MSIAVRIFRKLCEGLPFKVQPFFCPSRYLKIRVDRQRQQPRPWESGSARSLSSLSFGGACLGLCAGWSLHDTSITWELVANNIGADSVWGTPGNLPSRGASKRSCASLYRDGLGLTVPSASLVSLFRPDYCASRLSSADGRDGFPRRRPGGGGQGERLVHARPSREQGRDARS